MPAIMKCSVFYVTSWNVPYFVISWNVPYFMLYREMYRLLYRLLWCRHTCHRTMQYMSCQFSKAVNSTPRCWFVVNKHFFISFCISNSCAFLRSCSWEILACHCCANIVASFLAPCLLSDWLTGLSEALNPLTAKLICTLSHKSQHGWWKFYILQLRTVSFWAGYNCPAMFLYLDNIYYNWQASVIVQKMTDFAVQHL